MIRLQSKECVRAVIAAAKNLRVSDDEYVRCSVYINADLSPAEAKQAYERRQRRRERIAQQQTMVTTIHPMKPPPSPAPTARGCHLNPTLLAYKN